MSIMSCIDHCSVTNGFLHFSQDEATFTEAEMICKDVYGGTLATVKDVDGWSEIQERCCDDSSSRDYFIGLKPCPLAGGYQWLDESVCDSVAPLVEDPEIFTFTCLNVLVNPNQFLPNGFPNATLSGCDEVKQSHYICQSSVYTTTTEATTTTTALPVAGSTELSSASAPLLITLIALAVLCIIIIILALIFRKKLSAVIGGRKKKTYELKEHK